MSSGSKLERQTLIDPSALEHLVLVMTKENPGTSELLVDHKTHEPVYRIKYVREGTATKVYRLPHTRESKPKPYAEYSSGFFGRQIEREGFGKCKLRDWIKLSSGKGTKLERQL
jgi:hypothetical protein